MWRRVVLVWTNVSEERIASIFRVEKSASEEPAWAGGAISQKTAIYIVTAVKTLKSYIFFFCLLLFRSELLYKITFVVACNM
jgi:hypothetical protein